MVFFFEVLWPSTATGNEGGPANAWAAVRGPMVRRRAVITFGSVRSVWATWGPGGTMERTGEV